MTYPSPRLHFKAGYRFHNFIVLLDRMALLPPPAWIAFFLGAAALVAWGWPTARLFAFVMMGGPLLVEAFLLQEGKRSGKAPGPFGGPFFLFGTGHLLGGILLFLFPTGAIIPLHATLQVGLLLAMIYASRIEPYRVQWREEIIPGGPGGGKEIKILIFSDLHLDRFSPRETALLKQTREFAPDLILIPGDLTNLSFVGDPQTLESTRAVLRELGGLAPVFVSRGTPEVEPREWLIQLTAGTTARVIDHEKVEVMVGGIKLRLVGVPCDDDFMAREKSLADLMKGETDAPVILLHHSPDLGESAARLGVSLYAAGHTHGGQICLPVYGPLYTASRFGRKYAAGIYRIGKMTLVVSRGLGLEGAGAPRLRFLCPPEVIGIRWRSEAGGEVITSR